MIEIRERGSRRISDEEWRSISTDPTFRDLILRKVLEAAADDTRGYWRLKARGFVGNAIVGGRQLNIVEKVPGAYKAMMEIVALNSYKTAAPQGAVTKGEDPHSALIAMLLSAVRTYLSGSKLSEYRFEMEQGAYVTGRLSVRNTVALRARGIRHKVAFQRNRLTDDLPLNRVLYAALGVVASMQPATIAIKDASARSRALRARFQDSATSARLMSRKDVLAEAENEYAVGKRLPKVKEAAMLAYLVLKDSTAEAAAPDAAPLSWFLNLENLFERMLRTCISQELENLAKVGAALKRPFLFAGPPGRFPAGPDVVIYGDDGLIILADAKYKIFEDAPSPADIYELLAHASAYGARHGALFYPSEGDFAEIRMGQSSTGCRVTAFIISLLDPRSSIRRALMSLGFPLSGT